jgi:hypothetical protein
MATPTTEKSPHEGIRSYYQSKIDETTILLRDKIENLRRLQAQRNELNSRGMQSMYYKTLCLQY